MLEKVAYSARKTLTFVKHLARAPCRLFFVHFPMQVVEDGIRVLSFAFHPLVFGTWNYVQNISLLWGHVINIGTFRRLIQIFNDCERSRCQTIVYTSKKSYYTFFLLIDGF